jgi:DNA-3-methyladenine glycosylase
VVVARDLLGAILIHDSDEGRTAGRIVETEAYLAKGDSACHASRGQTKRNASMFGPPGLAYVYSIHSRYCLNAVTETEGVPSAVLIRALEPIEGVPLMQTRRRTEKLLDLCRGPARLCEAFAIGRAFDGHKLYLAETLWIERGQALTDAQIVTSTRIGVTSAQELMLRFFKRDSRFVSRPIPKRLDADQ